MSTALRAMPAILSVGEGKETERTSRSYSRASKQCPLLNS